MTEDRSHKLPGKKLRVRVTYRPPKGPVEFRPKKETPAKAPGETKKEARGVWRALPVKHKILVAITIIAVLGTFAGIFAFLPLFRHPDIIRPNGLIIEDGETAMRTVSGTLHMTSTTTKRSFVSDPQYIVFHEWVMHLTYTMPFEIKLQKDMYGEFVGSAETTLSYKGNWSVTSYPGTYVGYRHVGEPTRCYAGPTEGQISEDTVNMIVDGAIKDDHLVLFPCVDTGRTPLEIIYHPPPVGEYTMTWVYEGGKYHGEIDYEEIVGIWHPFTVLDVSIFGNIPIFFQSTPIAAGLQSFASSNFQNAKIKFDLSSARPQTIQFSAAQSEPSEFSSWETEFEVTVVLD